MAVTVGHIIRALEEFAPPYLAFPDDRIGLQVGAPSQPVSRVLVTLDVTKDVVDEAVGQKADMIISHHAVIFRPLKAMRADLPASRDIFALVRNGISVYTAHTNLDVAYGGVNDVLADRLQLRESQVLSRLQTESLRKLVVFVPVSHHEHVLRAVCEAGAGHIGNYSFCTFNTPGTGTFRPEEGAQPYIGNVGQIEQVEEIRLETVVPERLLPAVIENMLAAHPYEEVAYDVYPLEIMGKEYGIGRIGSLPETMPLEEFARFVKERLAVRGVRYCGSSDRIVKRVAVLGGAGVSWVREAGEKGADVLVTGDVKHHEALDALASGLAVIDAGHYGTEKWVVEALAAALESRLNDMGLDGVMILRSGVDTDPFVFV
jgi:dinuclear metal center YbgI/SA1388 family protein